MKKRKTIIGATVLLLLIGGFVVTPHLIINQAEERIDEGAPYIPDDPFRAPEEPFYEGISMLRSITWMPHYGGKAEEIIQHHMSAISSSYWNNYYNYVSDDFYALTRRQLTDHEFLVVQNSKKGISTPEFVYPDLISSPIPMKESDRLVFCIKWGRFEELIRSIYEQDSSLLVFIKHPVGSCD